MYKRIDRAHSKWVRRKIYEETLMWIDSRKVEPPGELGFLWSEHTTLYAFDSYKQHHDDEDREQPHHDEPLSYQYVVMGRDILRLLRYGLHIPHINGMFHSFYRPIH